MASSNGTTNGRARRTTRCASRSSASATAPTRCSRASSTTRTLPEDKAVPGLMHVDLGGYHISDIEFVAAFDVVKGKVGVDLADAIWAHPNDTIKFADVPKTGHHRLARHDPRRHRQVPVRGRREGAGRRPTTSSGSSRRPARTSSSTTSRSAPRRRPSGTPSRSSTPACAMVNCMPVFIAREPYWQRALRGGRRADHRRRHQVAGRRDDHAPRADDAVRRPRRPPRPHDAAERRRQLGLPEHARARSPRVEEDLEDERGHVDARLRHRRRRTSTSARPTTCRG